MIPKIKPKAEEKWKESKLSNIQSSPFVVEEQYTPEGAVQNLKAAYGHPFLKGIEPAKIDRMLELSKNSGIGPTELAEILKTNPKAPFNAMMDYVLKRKNKVLSQKPGTMVERHQVL